MTFSTTDFLDLVKMSTQKVFENPKHNPLIRKVTNECSQMSKIIFASFGIIPLITGSILLEA